MNQNEHVYAICCRSEVTTGVNVKDLEGYVLVTLKLLALVISKILNTNDVVTEEVDIDDSIKRKRFHILFWKALPLKLNHESW